MPKNIVLCFDGTSNNFGPAPFSNALKLYRLLDKDHSDQICYYQSGIGTSMAVDANPRFYCKAASNIIGTADALVAFSLDEHIIRGYSYLIRWYEKGDKVYIFGFSRGALAARILSSMIGCVGLLHTGLEEHARSAWIIYSAWEYSAQPSQPDYNTTLLDEFKMTFTREDVVNIEFLGLFDMVNSAGLFRDRMFPFSCSLGIVKYACHAVSLDERRGKFKQNLLYPHPYKSSLFHLESTPTSKTTSLNNSKRASSNTSRRSSIGSIVSRLHLERRDHRIDTRQAANIIEQASKSSTCSERMAQDRNKFISGDYQEKWFPGDHCDIGGCWPSDFNGQFSSNLPLRWMISEAIKRGLKFDKCLIVKFSERYSSIDSLLSCVHDTLSLKHNSLTRQLSRLEKAEITNLAQIESGYIPEFRSCEVYNDNDSLNDLFIKGFSMNTLKKLEANQKTSPSILRTYSSLPSSPIRSFDGHGSDGILRAILWWFIELLPIGTKIENENSRWENSYIPNLGRSRLLPEYASLHWSIYWKLKYCEDYNPRNLPAYATWLLDKVDINDSKLEPLVRTAYLELKSSLSNWDHQSWKNVPDDLYSTLKDYGYIVDINETPMTVD